MRVILDVPALTFDDYIDFEDATGGSVTDALAALAKNRASLREQRALVWIFGRRFDRTFTIEDAGSLNPRSIQWEIPSRDDDEGGD